MKIVCVSALVMAGLVVTAACNCQRPGPGDPPFNAEVIRFEALSDGPVVTDRASTGGVSLVDYDGDGDPDLFVTNGFDVSAEEPAAQPNQLYRNDDGTMVRVAEGPLAEDAGFSSGSTWADYDNDGDLDVFVSNQREQNNFLYQNTGDGSFSQITEGPVVSDGGHSYSAAWVDVDSDGFVDLFVANGGMSHQGFDFLYQNLGEGNFSRVTEGDLVSAEGSSCGSAWGDYDDDGDQDVVVTNFRFGTSPALYRNDGNFRFTRMEGVLDGPVFASSAALWADLDNDGDLDLVITGVLGLANRVYLNRGGGRLERVVSDAASLEGGNSYALTTVDAENDGDRDLVEANWGSAPALYLNNGDGGFSSLDVTRLGAGVESASSIASADINDDGLLDVVIGNWPNAPGPAEENLVLINRSDCGNWLRVKLVGTKSNRAGIGARIEVTKVGSGVRQIREVQTHIGWRSQNPLVQHFGLGSDDTVDVLVRWPSGTEDRLPNVAANQMVEIIEGSP